MPHDPMKPVVVRYEREQDMLRLTLSNLQNHELREIMVGLWARLDPADREDHIKELTEYQTNPVSWMSPVASAIARPEVHSGYIDLRRARRFEHGHLPGEPGGNAK